MNACPTLVAKYLKLVFKPILETSTRNIEQIIFGSWSFWLAGVLKLSSNSFNLPYTHLIGTSGRAIRYNIWAWKTGSLWRLKFAKYDNPFLYMVILWRHWPPTILVRILGAVFKELSSHSSLQHCTYSLDWHHSTDSEGCLSEHWCLLVYSWWRPTRLSLSSAASLLLPRYLQYYMINIICAGFNDLCLKL